ncbi:MAG: tetratricopeptide repeat protein [Rikenellaceae bacterium]
MRQLLSILSLTMLFLAGFAPTKGASYVDTPTDSLPLRQAVILSTDGQKRAHIYNDAAGADSLYRASIAADSAYAPAYYLLSQLNLNLRQPIDSVAKYAKRAYQLDTLNKWYGEAYAQALAMSGEYLKARKLYETAIEREPQNLNAYVMVAMLYSQTSEPLQALAVLDSAEVRTGKNSYVSGMKRDLLLATGQIERAVNEAVETVEIEPHVLENRLVLAELYASSQQDSLALVQYDAALAIDPTSTQALNSLAQFHIERGNFQGYFAATKQIFANPAEPLEGKLSTFTRLTSDRAFYAKNIYSISELATQLYLLYPTEKRVVELYAQHLIASGNLDLALETYKKHTADTPVQYDYYTTIIDIESYKQRVDSVELYAARAIEIFPDRHELRLSQANLYSYTGRYNEAIDRYRETIKIVPTDSLKGAIWGFIGDSYHQLSLREKPGGSKAKSLMRKAYKSYDTALKLHSTNPLVLNNYAYFLSLERRDLGQALDMAGRAIALVPNNPTYLDTYAWVLFELERYDEAKKIMRQVIALDRTESAEIQFHYAEILAKLGENFMAKVYYDKALKLGYNEQLIEQRKANLE